MDPKRASLDLAERRYVEDVALFFEEGGLPRIAGRILGLLLICAPPHRSPAELATEVEASKASVSTMTRMLLGAGLIERVGIPGERATYYQLADDGFERRFETLMRTLTGFRPLAERGLRVLADAPPQQRKRLANMAALYAFLEEEIPDLIARWRVKRESLQDEES